MSTSEITTFPAGYTATASDNKVWVASSHNHAPYNGAVRLMIHYPLADLVSRGFLKRDDDGNVVWDTAAMTVDYGVYRPIPDTELPDPASSMTRYHIHFNTETNKWELPDITDDVHAIIEARHDNDVGSARQNHVQWRVMERMMLLHYPDRTNADHQAKLREFYREWDNASGKDACIMTADAWRKSLGKVVRTEPIARYAETALANAMMFCANTPATAIRIQYVERLIERLAADAGKPHDASDRNYPRGVIFVKKLSSPRNPQERTIKSVVDAIKRAIAEG